MKVQHPAPPGKAWCSYHRRFHPVTAFNERHQRTRSRKLQTYCRRGQAAYHAAWKARWLKKRRIKR